MKIAIIGTGIAGNVAAHKLHAAGHDITVFEAGDHIGGHTHTHAIEYDGESHAIDTGFIVFNDRTYPNFMALLDELAVQSQPSSMSFSVRKDATGLEYNGTSLDGLFAQRRNLLSPGFHRMIADILRFHRESPKLLDQPGPEMPLADWLEAHAFRGRFVSDYLVPMGAAIWSTDPERMLQFPVRFFVRFLHNHGMLTVNDRPQWRVIRGGSARYVEKLVAPWRHRIHLNCPVESVRRMPHGVQVKASSFAPQMFDHVFLACHPDEALGLLADPSREERDILGAIPYQRNEAVLHTDASVLPRTRRAWAAWNYHVLQGAEEGAGTGTGTGAGGGVALTYNMNILQSLRSRHTYCVTLNASWLIDERKVLRRMVYHHPLFTPEGVAAQARHGEISGVRNTHYCGAWWRFGFHEDGVVSALEAVRIFSETLDAQRALPRVA